MTVAQVLQQAAQLMHRYPVPAWTVVVVAIAVVLALAYWHGYRRGFRRGYSRAIQRYIPGARRVTGMRWDARGFVLGPTSPSGT